METQDKRIVFFSPKNKVYLTNINNTVFCEKCEQQQQYNINLLRVYTKKTREEKYLCHKCLIEINKQPYGIYRSMINITLTNFIPDDAFPIFDLPPSLSNARDLDVWAAASKNLEGERVDDKTILCHDPNFMIQADAKRPEQIEADLKAKDKSMSIKEMDKYLKGLQDAELIIPEKKKLLK